MKKILSFLIISAVFLTSLAYLIYNNDGNYEVGIGIYASVTASDAEDDKNGNALTEYTFAAVIIDKNGKVVDCDIDASANGAVAVAKDGKTSVNNKMTTKKALGDSYGMQQYAHATEWYIQADRFEKVVIGKTLDQIKNLVLISDDEDINGKGNNDVVNAGCTIKISEFVLAIEKAYANAKSVKLNKVEDTDEISASLGVAVSSKGTNADSQKSGSATFTGVATSAFKLNGTLVSCITDESEVSLSVTNDGKIEGEEASYKSKREKGDAYGMHEYAGTLEWYVQVDAFDKACEGKTADEIAALMNTAENYGYVKDVVSSCTIYAGNLVMAAMAAAE